MQMPCSVRDGDNQHARHGRQMCNVFLDNVNTTQDATHRNVLIHSVELKQPAGPTQTGNDVNKINEMTVHTSPMTWLVCLLISGRSTYSRFSVTTSSAHGDSRLRLTTSDVLLRCHRVSAVSCNTDTTTLFRHTPTPTKRIRRACPGQLQSKVQVRNSDEKQLPVLLMA